MDLAKGDASVNGLLLTEIAKTGTRSAVSVVDSGVDFRDSLSAALNNPDTPKTQYYPDDAGFAVVVSPLTVSTPSGEGENFVAGLPLPIEMRHARATAKDPSVVATAENPESAVTFILPPEQRSAEPVVSPLKASKVNNSAVTAQPAKATDSADSAIEVTIKLPDTPTTTIDQRLQTGFPQKPNSENSDVGDERSLPMSKGVQSPTLLHRTEIPIVRPGEADKTASGVPASPDIVTGIPATDRVTLAGGAAVLSGTKSNPTVPHRSLPDPAGQATQTHATQAVSQLKSDVPVFPDNNKPSAVVQVARNSENHEPLPIIQTTQNASRNQSTVAPPILIKPNEYGPESVTRLKTANITQTGRLPNSENTSRHMPTRAEGSVLPIVELERQTAAAEPVPGMEAVADSSGNIDKRLLDRQKLYNHVTSSVLAAGATSISDSDSRLESMSILPVSVVPAVNSTVTAPDGISPSTALNLNNPELPVRLNQQIRMMIDSGIQSATLQVKPAELGPVQIDIKIDQEQLSVNISAVNVHAKDLLESTLTRLRDQLVALSFEQVDVNVSQQNRNSGQSDGEQAMQRQAIAVKGLSSENNSHDEQVDSGENNLRNTHSGKLDAYA